MTKEKRTEPCEKVRIQLTPKGYALLWAMIGVIPMITWLVIRVLDDAQIYQASMLIFLLLPMMSVGLYIYLMLNHHAVFIYGNHITCPDCGRRMEYIGTSKDDMEHHHCQCGTKLSLGEHTMANPGGIGHDTPEYRKDYTEDSE